ncbi:MAG: sn-glycerol-3-phosphate ABC transporter ATP-binding protein UgpC [Planctomycetes bacterium]|nr:sn-glycerol-3-phosphate ABC transporter ATP-binding protein UgpC [Planctomycetota bacterium]
MAQVVLQDARKLYAGGIEAVRAFSLDVADGEFVVLVGPSGCGKSTTLRMIAGLEQITSGTISIGGRVVNDVAPKDRDVAMVFQNYALYPHMTVSQNMGFALRLRRVPRGEIERRVGDAARILGIEELLQRRPGQLSGGQRQRVALGRAIVREPKAFLFDEPLSNLDAKLRVTTRAELKALHMRLSTTTIYVTHDQEEAMTLGDRVVVMSRGEIQQTDAPLNVYRKPANRFVASFIGMPPMSFLEGTIVSHDGSLVFAERHEGLRLVVAPEHRSLVQRHTGRPVVLGIRPQALSEARGREGSAIELNIRVIEPIGESMDVFATTAGGGELIARVPAREGILPGPGARFMVDPTGVHYFEPGEFGRSLLAAGAD